jgi:hypothetical protein
MHLSIGRRRRTPSSRARALWPSLLALLGLFGMLLAPANVGAWDWTTPKIDFIGEEAMRLINVDRTGNGKAALYSDPKLINFARDLAWTCPTNSSLTIRGRARDMIDRAYFAHSIKGCYKSGSTLYSVIDIMSTKFGYKYGRGEIIAGNTYGVAATAYKYGCDSAGANCNGSTTTTATNKSAQYWWMHSSAHRGIILGAYDRFGCGVWRGGGKTLYACLFAKTGPNALDTTSPTISNLTGNGASVPQGSSITLSAKLTDNFRLAEGWLRKDATSACGGTTLSAWAYNLNVVSETHSFTWNTTGVTKGTHAIGWRIRDVSTRASSCYIIHVTVT